MDERYIDNRYPACQRKESNKMASQKVTASLSNDKGTWTVRGWYYDPVTGKKRQRRRSTGLKVKDNTKKKAKAMMQEIIAEWQAESDRVQTAAVNPEFGTCVNKWIERKGLTVRANTLESYKVAAKAHIIPELGKTGICDISRQQLQAYYDKLQRDGISANTMKKHRVIIKGTLKDAVIDGLIPVNIADYVSLPKTKEFEGKQLTESQVAEVLKALDELDDPLKTAITLALVFGLRREEICGLRWEDIDFENSVLSVRNTVTEYAGKVYRDGDTKTRSSRRDLYIPEETADYLKQVRERQEQSGIDTGKVCAWKDGKEVKPAYITRASMRFLKSCGFEGVRLHDLRGTALSILARKLPIKNVQTFAGHNDVHTTLKYYVHVMDEDKRETANVMANFLRGCAESCAESEEHSSDNVIPFNPNALEKCADA